MRVYIEKKDYKSAIRKLLKDAAKEKGSKILAQDGHYSNQTKFKKLKSVFTRYLALDKEIKGLLEKSIERKELDSFLDRFLLVLNHDFLSSNSSDLDDLKKDIVYFPIYKDIVKDILGEIYGFNEEKNEEIIKANYKTQIKVVFSVYGIKNLVGIKQINFLNENNIFFVAEGLGDKNGQIRIARLLKTPIELALLLNECKKSGIGCLNFFYDPVINNLESLKQLNKVFSSYYDLVNKIAILRKVSGNAEGNFLRAVVTAYFDQGFVHYSKNLKYDISDGKIIFCSEHEKNEERKKEGNEEVFYLPFSSKIKDFYEQLFKVTIEKNRYDIDFIFYFLDLLNLPNGFVGIYKDLAEKIERNIFAQRDLLLFEELKKPENKLLKSHDEKNFYFFIAFHYALSTFKDVHQFLHIFKAAELSSLFYKNLDENYKHVALDKMKQSYEELFRKIINDVNNGHYELIHIFSVIADDKFFQKEIRELALKYQISFFVRNGYYKELEIIMKKNTIQDLIESLSINPLMIIEEAASKAIERFYNEKNEKKLLEIMRDTSCGYQLRKMALKKLLEIYKEERKFKKRIYAYLSFYSKTIESLI
jgi:hypothetical protein